MEILSLGGWGRWEEFFKKDQHDKAVCRLFCDWLLRTEKLFKESMHSSKGTKLP